MVNIVHFPTETNLTRRSNSERKFLGVEARPGPPLPISAGDAKGRMNAPQLDYNNPFARPSGAVEALNKKEGDRWVRYRWERRGNGFFEIAVDSQGRPIDISDPANWRSLADVWTEQQTFDGIALVQTPESNIACITLRNVNRRFHTEIPDVVSFIPDIHLQHEWANYIRGRGDGGCYIEPLPCGWRLIGTTRLTEPYVRIRKGMRDKFDPNPIDPEAGYECYARTTQIIPIRSCRGRGDPLVSIDSTFELIETYLSPSTDRQPKISIAAGPRNPEYRFDETRENITRFCTALTYVDPSDYHGNPNRYPGAKPDFCLGWFEGMCAIASLPWKRALKDAIAIWWSKRTTRNNYPGDDRVVCKLNLDLSADRRDGITYRSVFKFAHERGCDGR
jgi:hypothetical protein